MERPAKRPNVARPRASKRTQNATPPPSQSPVKNLKDDELQKLTCPNPECTDPEFEEFDDIIACTVCGCKVKDVNIVNEVTFGETSAGAAVVQGAFVGADQRNAHTIGPNFRRVGPDENHEVSENRGREQINRLSNAMEPNLNETIRNQAMVVYRLLLGHNFIQGRQVQEVAASCLYYACRRSKDNQVLLMDFAEILQVSVYKLGKYYADIKQELCLETFDNNGSVPVIQPERLIYRFARRMEFKDKLMRVCEDASKLMKRMKRDWMVTGRSPAGLCGACLILAARMNNFRRTIRETVFHVRVAGLTVQKRLDEFKRTKASELSVDDFRSKAHLLKQSADPPSVYRRQEEEERKRRETESETPSSAPRVDADGFAVPDPPTQLSKRPSGRSPSVESAAGSEASGTRGRKRKRKDVEPTPTKVAPFLPTAADLLEEEMLEDEINHLLDDPQVLGQAAAESAEDMANRAQAIAAAERSKLPAGPAVSDNENIDEAEFADDPEVANCVLNEREQKIKERIWVTHNEDWLRTQQAKLLKKTLDEAHGVPKRKPNKKTRKRTRMGDGSLLEDSGPVSSPAEATQRMLEKHSKNFSKHIDYDRLNQLYRGIRNEKSSAAGSATNGTSFAGSETAATSSYAAPSRASSAAPSEAYSEASVAPAVKQKRQIVAAVGAREAAAGILQKAALRKAQREHRAEGDVEDDADLHSNRSGPESNTRDEDGPEEIDILEEQEEDDNVDGADRSRRYVQGLGVDDDMGIDEYEDDDPSRYLEEDEQVGFDEDEYDEY